MDKKPNIILVITEQHRGDCLGIDGHPVLQTPTMDNLAHQGVRFTRAFSTCPTCIAARRSILSGQFPPTHGMVGYQDGVEWDAPPTLPGVLRDNGYHTMMVGRSMHQSPPRKRYGYDHMITNTEYWEWLERNQPKEAQGWWQSGVLHNDYTIHPWPFDEHLHMTNWIVDRGLEAVEKRDPTCPFFLTLSFLSAHPPLIPPQFYLDRYLRTGVPDPHIGTWETPPANGGLGLGPETTVVDLKGEVLLSARAGYYALINHMDDQLRRFFSVRVGIGQEVLNNTIIAFVSDHGEMLGDHYRWHKILPLEGAARIPYIIKAPRGYDVEPRQVLDETVCLEDIMPTLLDMAGIDVPETVEGKSLLPLMQKKCQKLDRTYIHIEHAPSYHCLTNGKEKFIWYVHDGTEQYFDLSTDPNELHNRIDDAACRERVSEWRTLMIRELKDRPEGFSDGGNLITGCAYHAVLSERT